MFHGISASLLVWFFPTSVFGVEISFWLRLFLIFAYLYLFNAYMTKIWRTMWSNRWSNRFLLHVLVITLGTVSSLCMSKEPFKHWLKYTWLDRLLNFQKDPMTSMLCIWIELGTNSVFALYFDTNRSTYLSVEIFLLILTFPATLLSLIQ